MTLRVGIDLCRIDPAALGAADHATVDTLEQAAATPPAGVTPVLFGSRSLRDARPALFEAFESHVAPFPPSAPVLRVAAEATWLRAVAGRARLDLLHDAGGTSPLGVEVPEIVSVHDLAAFEAPRGLGRARVAYHRRVVPRALADAAAVVVPSEHVRTRLLDLFGVEVAKVRVVPWPLPPHAEAARIDMVRARHGIVGRFVLVSDATPPEAQVVAVRAMRHLVGRHNETTLVLLGGAAAQGPVAAEIRALGLAERAVAMPAVTEPVRAALVEHAVALVHLGVAGGFAPSVLEAMACGVPVVVADGGPARELVGGAGAVVAASDDAQLAIEVHRVLDDPDWRARMASAGLERARSHTPAAAADALFATYRSVLAAL